MRKLALVILGLFVLFLLTSCGGGGVRTPAFDIALDTTSLRVQQGQEGTLNLTISPQRDFRGTVRLALEMQDGTPAPEGLTLSPEEIYLPGPEPKKVALLIGVPICLPPANLNLKLKATSGSIAKYADFNLTVVATESVDLNWSAQTLQFVVFRDVTYAPQVGGGTFVAVGYIGPGGAVWTSSGGSTWGPNLVPSNKLYGVTFGNGLFVAVGEQGSILTSPNGIDWTPLQDSGTSNNLWGVAYGNGRFVAVGEDIILTSTNGTSWDQIYPSGYFLYGVTYGGGKFVAVGENGTIVTSLNAFDWELQNYSGPNLRGVDYGNGRFVAVGDQGTIVTSSDGGITWTQENSGTYSNLWDVAHRNCLFVAVGNGGTIRTKIPWWGLWKSQSSGTPLPLYGVTYGNGQFVVVGWETILTATF